MATVILVAERKSASQREAGGERGGDRQATRAVRATDAPTRALSRGLQEGEVGQGDDESAVLTDGGESPRSVPGEAALML